MCTAAIIAGGVARRFDGRAKGALAFGATSIIERQIAVLREITKTLLIVANDAAPYAGLGVPVINDEISGAGPIGGIYTALVHATADPVVVLACDMPFIHAAFLRHLVSVDPSADVTIPRTANGYEPMCACYSRRCAPHLRRQIDEGVFKIQELLPHVQRYEIGPDEISDYDPDGLLFYNVNTPDDYARALKCMDSDPSTSSYLDATRKYSGNR